MNDAPVINPIEDITMIEDSIAGPIKIEFSNVETPKDELSLSVASSNTHLVPNYAIHVLPEYSMMISPLLRIRYRMASLYQTFKQYRLLLNRIMITYCKADICDHSRG